MEIKTKLMQRIGIISSNLSAEFIQFDIEDRIPTVAMLSEKYEIGRGTVQSALKLLQEYGAIRLEARGHLGTYITYIDYLKLLEIAGIKSLVGVMPLPYSKRYEGLATGLYKTLDEQGISINLAFMRGANHRLNALKDGRYDFAITSRLTAEFYIKNKEKIQIIGDFGDYSYVNDHILAVRKKFNEESKNIIRVGIDKSSIDQSILTELYFKNHEVEYINMSYNSFKISILNDEIDAAIWNKDDIDDIDANKINIICMNKEDIGISDTEAVIIALEKNTLLPKVFSKKLNREKVLLVQKGVLNGTIMPNY